jgi:hypothetical protein
MKEGVAIGDRHMGPLALMDFLELHLGLSNSCSNKIERLFQYRSNLDKNAKKSFYEKSFNTNDLEVTNKLLQWRDELKMAGWDFKTDWSMPQRLKDMAGVETHSIGTGVPERFCAIIDELNKKPNLPKAEIIINEPEHLLPAHFKKLFKILQANGVDIRHRDFPLTRTSSSGLDTLRDFVFNKKSSKEKAEMQADGSIQVIKFGDMLSAGKGLATYMSADTTFKPVVINESGNISLSLSLQQSGLPSTGQSMRSASHPDLQLLAIIPVWLWKPYQPQQVLDFFLSPLNIFHKGVSGKWINSFSENPGICLEDWLEEINKYEYFNNPGEDKAKQQDRLHFILSRAKERSEKMPIENVIECYSFFYTIFNNRCAVTTDDKIKVRLKRLCNAFQEFLNILKLAPEKDLALFGLQKLLQLVLQPVSITPLKKEAGTLHELAATGLLTGACDDVLWFGFTANNSGGALWDELTVEELEWLNKQNVYPDTAVQKAARDFWYATQWLKFVKKRIFFIIPSVIEGEPSQPHSFHAFLIACFKNLDAVTINVEQPEEMKFLKLSPKLTKKIPVTPIPTFPDYWQISPGRLTKRENEESYSSLEKLMKYPYHWVLGYKAKLYRGNTLCLESDFKFYGNLSHKIFEELLVMKDILKVSDQEVKKRYKVVAEKLIDEKGLLLHKQGEEANLKIFRELLCNKFLILLKHLKDNKWAVEGCEIIQAGKIGSENVMGKCDLLLYRAKNKKLEKAIVDLKYTGRSKYRKLMQDGDDLQLAIYSRIFDPLASFCATSYFIIIDGLLFTTCKDAFNNGISLRHDLVYSNTYATALNRIENTIKFRRKELSNGKIEVGEQVCTVDLDVFNLDEKTHILPAMKEKAKVASEYNDYQTFIDTE